MKLDYRKYKFFCLSLVCVLLMPVGVALSADNSPLPVTHGEIIRDTARVTFEWEKPVGFTVASKDRKVTITFERKSDPDVSAILSNLYPFITNIERNPDRKTIILTMDKPYKVRKFVSHNIGGIDLLGVEPGARHINTAENIIMPSVSDDSGPDTMKLAQSDSESAAKLAQLEPAADTPAATKDKADEGNDSAASPDAGEKEYHMQINKVAISSADDSATLRFPLADRTAFAVFKRNHHLWVVLEKPVKLDLSEFNDLTKTVIRKPEIIANPKATILYIPIDDNVYTTITKEDNTNRIAILITQKKSPTAFPLPVEVSTSPPAPPHVLISTLEMEDPIVVHDPLIGDSIVITPLYKIGEAITHDREFIEFDLLETIQGVAVVKKADDVSIVQLRNGLRVTTSKGATISPGLPKLDVKAANDGLQANPTLFPFEIWKSEITKSRAKQLQKLFHDSVETDNVQDANNARLRAAQIFLSDGMAAEAMALLDGINRADPSFYRSAKLSAMRGAANFLMTRFIESARDFSATELNNNKEIEYWRSVLSDLLGNSGQTYDYLSMNEDYISKYPPVFRQKLAIVAADRAIGAKEYNIALKIFDTLHQDNLLDSINAYINFLMAKISMDTGQDKDATETLDKLADDIKHPFVRARAEFTRIARDMDAGMNKDKAIDRLEKLRLDWHGDNLELKVLTLLGELYYEKKDYVNAMRVWNNGVKSFKNTTDAIDMARKMEEVFITMFNEGIADKLPPLEALALYYEYRNYMPGGTAGNEMLDRLADRLISVDLLEQAAGLLDHQMRSQTEKERRSRIGTKLATTYLMNHQPQKAIIALQDSVYGENPVLLRLLRNRLAAQATMELGKPELAMQTLGQDDSPEAEQIRINIYWKAKDWTKLIASVENLLKTRPDITAPITVDESESLIKLALAYIFTDNKQQLQYLHDYFGPLMAKNPNRKVFEFVTAQDIIPNSRNFDDVIQSVSNTRLFIENYHARIKTADITTPNNKKATK